MPFRLSSILTVAMFLTLAAGCSQPGQRLLKARIEQGGNVILRAQFSVPDRWSAHAAWGELEKQTFESVGGWQPDPSAPLPVTIKGKIKLALDHAGTPFAAAEVPYLRLQPDPAKAATWQLAPGEAARTAKAMK